MSVRDDPPGPSGPVSPTGGTDGAIATKEEPAETEPTIAEQVRRGPARFWPVLLVGILAVVLSGALGLRQDAQTAVLVLVVVIALVFDYTNGFHDAANAIATSVS
ncbi:MAG TPA: hypothetical protein VIL71_11730, partial [Spirillospora sp.]